MIRPMSVAVPKTVTSRPLILGASLFVVGIAVVAGIGGKMSGELALLVGVTLGLSGFGFGPLGSRVASWSLRACIICLGLRTELGELLRASSAGFTYALLTISAALISGWLLGKLFRVETGTSILISSGTAICGGSAIAAIGPAIDAKPAQMTVAFGTVFLLNTVALILLPPMGHYFGMSAHEFGTWAGMAIHDVASVVGAAQTFSPDSLDTATSVKLSRALWIIPLAVGFSWWNSRRQDTTSAGPEAPRRRPSLIPWVMICFLAAAAFRSVCGPAIKPLPVGAVANVAMALTLFLIGTSLTPSTLKAVGPRALFQGASVWLVLLVLSAFVSVHH